PALAWSPCMARVLIAVADSPFPSLDPAKAALAGIDFEMHMAKSPTPDDILAVARDADAILVTFAKLDGPLLRQLTRCKSIVRFGNIPRMLAPKAKAFGLRVVAYDPFAKAETFTAAGVEGVSLDRLLEISDFVSLHAPLNDATRCLFNADVFRKMKKGALLIN